MAQIENFQGWVGELVADANPLLSALLVDGIIGGVGAVVGFLPLVMVMYFLIALLEDCGSPHWNNSSTAISARQKRMRRGNG